MARRSEESQLSEAFRIAYETAGVSQIQIAEACEVDQPAVSKWARGERQIPLWALPIIDELCDKPKGYVLRLAGYVDPEVDVVELIRSDSTLSIADRTMLVSIYERMHSTPEMG